ncbi:2-oxoglutarate dehydrogenase complex, dehydrogenase (E1) component,-related enzymes [Comamonas testosteroni TK102]|uniref:2-oxoglutarate dehydrogenase complex, dehydrogenase (E1) component,-related enzymes n=1 Tax=Comamonas testosteroni TK102 TaxID=1392005 RepID=A0A076PQG1_COMTE|nr:hypothetical protein [Comamonas testosteroni]AIJ45582.1 2-oxoglutarate dehydrogenase complex, dehydrogenase (E1) component,-related enzymes [Comamonas testosteroni TK102]
MTDFTKSDLFYTDYSDSAVPGDDPKKTKEDRTRVSRHESYEVVTLINSISFTKGTTEAGIKRGRQIIEWMIHEHLPSNIQGRDNVKKWITDNFSTLKPSFPR